MKNAIDPGFGQKFHAPTKRIINPDGTFNVVRRNNRFNLRDLFQYLIHLSWAAFLGLILLFYSLLNLVFTFCYYVAGLEHIRGLPAVSGFEKFLYVGFFSVQTFTTVGYGTMSPEGIPANLVASLEAMSGWLFFALATGLLYGRFSRPSSRILFSRNVLVVPAQSTNRLMFRIVNQRRNMIVELEAKVLVMFVDRSSGGHNRRYFNLKLERSTVSFFPINWTVVHDIDSDSPLFGKTPQELAALNAELLILLKGYDDTFKQTLHTRYSYRHEEFVWGARFRRAYEIDPEGNVVIDLNWLHEFEEAELQDLAATTPDPGMQA